MPIQVTCPSCRRKLRVPDALYGKRVKCPTCQTPFTAEDEPVEEPPVEEEEPPRRPARRPAPAEEEEYVEERPRRRPARTEEEDYEDEPPDEEYEERPRRKRRRSRRYEEARSLVAGPAICLMVVGSLAIALAVVGLILNLTGAALGGAQGVGNRGDRAGAIGNAVGGLIGAIIGLCWGGAVLGGAIQMKSLKNFGAAMTGTIVAMVPCNLCCLLGLPFGIWALVVLNKPEVKDAFS